jgi:hypothetical protein
MEEQLVSFARQVVEDVRADLAAKMAESDPLLQGDEARKARAEQREALADMTQELKKAQAELREAEEACGRGGRRNVNGGNGGDGRTRTAPLPRNLPTWEHSLSTSKKQCTDFLLELRAKFIAASFPQHGAFGEQRWVGALLEVVVGPEEKEWVLDDLIGPGLSWDEAQEAFVARYAQLVDLFQPARELAKAKQGGDGVDQFFAKFLKKVNATFVGQRRPDWKVTDSYYTYVFVLALRPALADKVLRDRRLKEAQEKGLDEVAKLAKLVEGETLTAEATASLRSGGGHQLGAAAAAARRAKEQQRKKASEQQQRAAAAARGRGGGGSGGVNGSHGAGAKKGVAGRDGNTYTGVVCGGCGSEGHHQKQCTLAPAAAGGRPDRR